MAIPEYRSPFYMNPAPLGNSGFAVTTLAAALHGGGIGAGPTSAVVGLALFCGGVAQLVAGAWSFATRAAFGGVVFSLYGCYWLAYATMLIPASGVAAALEAATPAARAQSAGAFYLVWTIQTAIFTLAAARGAWGTFVQLALLLLTTALSCVGAWAQAPAAARASCYTGILTAAVAWYNVAADMLTRETFYFALPNPPISPGPGRDSPQPTFGAGQLLPAELCPPQRKHLSLTPAAAAADGVSARTEVPPRARAGSSSSSSGFGACSGLGDPAVRTVA
ncbi:hypothetical protein H4R18_004134 [Coemansia javaensis]|uniref:Uncharacterized protein n=1 Tax=Coemansia javaensis TaxID=2761396 RepID=A0A9W8LHJ9_9FUNG|nr:hypothetical protein H4R18_004134 [Coemansia javaensis]